MISYSFIILTFVQVYGCQWCSNKFKNFLTFFPKGRILLCRPRYSGIQYVDKAGLTLKRFTCLCLQSAGIYDLHCYAWWGRIVISSSGWPFSVPSFLYFALPLTSVHDLSKAILLSIFQKRLDHFILSPCLCSFDTLLQEALF